MLRGAAGIPNGQPKLLLNLFWEDYPLINFAICSALYVFLSHRLFVLTNDLKNVVRLRRPCRTTWTSTLSTSVSTRPAFLSGFCTSDTLPFASGARRGVALAAHERGGQCGPPRRPSPARTSAC